MAISFAHLRRPEVGSRMCAFVLYHGGFERHGLRQVRRISSATDRGSLSTRNAVSTQPIALSKRPVAGSWPRCRCTKKRVNHKFEKIEISFVLKRLFEIDQVQPVRRRHR
jgi:hypothetical protein